MREMLLVAFLPAPIIALSAGYFFGGMWILWLLLASLLLWLFGEYKVRRALCK